MPNLPLSRILLRYPLPRLFPSQVHTFNSHSLTHSTTKKPAAAQSRQLHPSRRHHRPRRSAAIMSSKEFSNTSTGDAPADPYTAKNKDEPALEEKIETVSAFVSSCKFGMMTTLNVDTKLLVSRCMAVAAKVNQ